MESGQSIPNVYLIRIENGKVVCPWHGWAWDPKTGAAEQDAKATIAVYPLKVENGDVLIEI